jgi:hypothetical protein
MVPKHIYSLTPALGHH